MASIRNPIIKSGFNIHNGVGFSCYRCGRPIINERYNIQDNHTVCPPCTFSHSQQYVEEICAKYNENAGRTVFVGGNRRNGIPIG